jgi:hypothetical protein
MRNAAGWLDTSGAYHATPKPSPFIGPLRSSLAKLCLINECTGSVMSLETSSDGP